jgi:hypothetical protein
MGENLQKCEPDWREEYIKVMVISNGESRTDATRVRLLRIICRVEGNSPFPVIPPWRTGYDPSITIYVIITCGITSSKIEEPINSFSLSFKFFSSGDISSS